MPGQDPTPDTTPEDRHALVGRPEVWAMKRQFQIDFLRQRGLQPHHTVLDIGCGTLRGGLPIIEYLNPGGYTGLDVRSVTIDEAKAELEEAGLAAKTPDLRVVEDLGTVDLGERFDLIWAFSVLIHLRPEQLDGAFACADRHLAPQGRFFGNVTLPGAPIGWKGRLRALVASRWQGFPVVRHPLSFYEERADAHGMVVSDLGSLTSLGHGKTGRPDEHQRMLELTRAPGSP